MVSEQIVSFRNTFRAMVQAMLSVKLNVGGEAIYKFTYMPHLHFYVTSCIIKYYQSRSAEVTVLHKQMYIC